MANTGYRRGGARAHRKQAATIRAGTIRAGTIRAGTIRAGTIRAGTIRAGTIRAGTARADGPGSEQRPTFSDRLPRPWLFPVLAFAAAWVLILVAWQASNAIWHPAVTWTYLFRYKDANVYAVIAANGYHIPF